MIRLLLECSWRAQPGQGSVTIHVVTIKNRVAAWAIFVGSVALLGLASASTEYKAFDAALRVVILGLVIVLSAKRLVEWWNGQRRNRHR